MTKKFQQFHLTVVQDKFTKGSFSTLFRKISAFPLVATAQGNTLEKLFQLGVPRLIFQNKSKILLTEVLVGSSSLIPEPVCTCAHPEPSQANKNLIPEVHLCNWV